jgi:hypothetical protein
MVSDCLCLKTIKALWGQLSSAWLRTSCYGVCFKSIEALLYGSQV